MGKISVIMVFGFNLVFMFMGFSLSGVATRSYSNYTNYYTTEQAQFLAESAANIALGSINQNLLWLSTDSSVHSYTIYDPSNPATVLGTYSTQAKISWPNGLRTVTFNITSTCGVLSQNTTVVLNTPQFAQFALYSVNDGGLAWTTGEVCDGPLHTEGSLVTTGSADFKGYVTVAGSISSSGASPIFEAGKKTGVSIPFVSDYSAVTALPGYDSLDTPITGTGSNKKQADLFVQFNKDGTIEVDTGKYVGDGLGYYTAKQGGSKYTKYANAAALTSSGVFGILNPNAIGNIHIRGTVVGKVTVANLGSGNIYIDSSVVYKDTTQDILGIVAKDSVYVTDDTLNNRGSVNIQATICASSFTAQHYDTRVSGPPGTYSFDSHGNRINPTARGSLNLRGGIQQYNRGAVWSGNYGFDKMYKYDTRFLGTGTAPGYPTLTQFSLVSWYDKTNWSSNWWNSW